MPTPRTRDPEARIAAIRRAAAEIVVESGLDALTHRAVAARAGVAVGTTTKYFSGIDDLRRSALEVLGEHLRQELDGLDKALASADDVPAYLAQSTAHQLADRKAVLAECSLTFAGLFEEDFRELSLLWYRGLIETLTPYVGAVRAEVLAQFLDGVTVNTALLGEAPTPERLRPVIDAVVAMPVPTDQEQQ